MERATDMPLLQTFALFALTAVAEILGFYLPYLWLKKEHSAWLLLPAALSLALSAWLISLDPTASGRVYAAYSGVYIGAALLWLWLVDGIRPNITDLAGAGSCLAGMVLIMADSRHP